MKETKELCIKEDIISSEWNFSGGKVKLGKETGIIILPNDAIYPLKIWCLKKCLKKEKNLCTDLCTIGIDFLCLTEKRKEEQGLSFVIEGIDGAGKTTQCLELVEWLNHQVGRCSAYYAKSPKGCASGERIRSFIDNRIDNREEVCPEIEMIAFLFANTFFYREVVVPRLLSGKIIIFDRWTTSFLNYFHSLFGFPLQSLEFLNRNFMGDFQATKTILLDLPVETAARRIKQKQFLSRFDKSISMDCLEKQRQGFLKLAKQYNWTVLTVLDDSEIQAIQADLRMIITPFL
ncbi:MAG: dTMP kinase [bacterium]|nr:dTMP kinase [bacterium]